MRRRTIVELKPGQGFSMLGSTDITHIRVDVSVIPLASDAPLGAYSLRLSDGLVQWQMFGLVVYTESQYEAAKRIGNCGEGAGINWEWFYFASAAQAEEFVKWCDQNDIENRGVSWPQQRPEPGKTDKFFGVRCR